MSHTASRPKHSIGTLIQTHEPYVDSDHDGSERTTEGGSWGYVEAILPNQEACYSVVYATGASAFLSDADLSDARAFRAVAPAAVARAVHDFTAFESRLRRAAEAIAAEDQAEELAERAELAPQG